MAKDSKKKRKVGRPPVPPEVRRSSAVRIFLTEAHKEALQAMADKKGVATAELIFRHLCKFCPEPPAN
jgi:hypothetical protein